MNDQEHTAGRPAEEPDGDRAADRGFAREGETAATEAVERPGEPKRLTRSRDDRMLAGVAGGLGRYFAVDPLIFRIGFGVSVFFGGLGALAYLALALFVPSDPEPGGERALAPVQRSRWLAVAVGVVAVGIALSAAGSLFFWGDWGWGGDGPWGLLVLVAIGAGLYALFREREPGEPMNTRRTLAAIGLGIVAVAALAALAVASAYTAATGSGIVIAIAVIAIGVLLIVAAFRGGARWLVAPALAIAIPLGAVSAADVSFAGGVGDRYHQPASIAELEDRYELGIGRLVVDLRDLDWSREATEIPLEVSLGVGQATVIVPERVCVAPDLHVGAGEIVLGNGRTDGVDLDEESSTTSVAERSLLLVGEVDLGSLRVLNDYDAGGHGPFGRFDDPGSEDRAAVC